VITIAAILNADMQRLKALRLMDDDFFTKCFEDDTASIELILRIILKEADIKVTNVVTQKFVKNIIKQSLRLDVEANTADGRAINIEIQRSDNGAGRKRARYHSSMMDCNVLAPNEKFDKLKDTYVIFITENDVLNKGLPLYHIERIIQETNEWFCDGSHIIYVNGKCQDNTPLGRLMHDFYCTKPSEMYYRELAERVRYFKESKEGTQTMCKIMEDMRKEALEQGIERGIKRGKKLGEQEGIKRGKKLGKQEGILEGMEKMKQETAVRMLALGKNTLEEISIISGISLENIRNLQQTAIA